MKKIQLTQEQADAIEYALNETDDYKDDEDRLLRDISREYVNFHNDLFPLNKIDIAVAAKALYVGYEVIPQFNAGEWLFLSKEATDNEPEVRQIINVRGGQLDLSDGYTVSSHSEYIRHATPEEIQQEKKRRFWDKLGREVDEYKPNDLVVTGNFEYGLIAISFGSTEGNNRPVKLFARDELLRVHIDNLRLVTPVEQRLDK